MVTVLQNVTAGCAIVIDYSSNITNYWGSDVISGSAVWLQRGLDVTHADMLGDNDRKELLDMVE